MWAKGQRMREYYSITELTREFDISTRTLRFYEDEGLIQPVRRGRTRLFRPSDRHLVRQILRGKRLGFSINEIREIIQIYREPPGEVGQLKLLMKRINEKKEDLRQKRRDLEETLAELDQAEESCVERLVELGVNT
jgi:DNA-binding transcriptional MerR regulator